MLRLLFTTVLALAASIVAAQDDTLSLKVLMTSDIHGSFLPYDYLLRREAPGTLARASTYIKEQRASYGPRLLLMDNGDILQGTPLVYYYNYIASDEENIAASAMNYVGYNVHTYGNHDIETGHAIYDKWAAETHATLVCANLEDTQTGETAVAPYYLYDCEGVRIAVVGILTTATPCWISEDKYCGLRFVDALSAAKKWGEYVRRVEGADLVFGLFHTGLRGGIDSGEYVENGTERIVEDCDSYDAIFFGHDHTVCCEERTTSQGHKVWLLNPANACRNLAELDVTIVRNSGSVVSSTLTGNIVDVSAMPVDSAFVDTFVAAHERVAAYTNQEVGVLKDSISTHDAYFGPSSYMSLLHNVQLSLTGADVSFCAPLQYDATIASGLLTGADMFSLYKYDNRLCTVQMTGREIRNYLEYSYGLWAATMNTPDDHLLLLLDEDESKGAKVRGMVNPMFNFDSAQGIDYTVDVSQPIGKRVAISQFTSGAPFSDDATYTVAMNAYRANNGGEHLSRGAGIAKSAIPERILWQSDYDLRHYLMLYIQQRAPLSIAVVDNWYFAPTTWTTAAAERDKALLFGK